MRLSLLLAGLLLASPALAAPTVVGSKTPLKPIVSGLKNPESVCIGPEGVAYVTCIGDFDKKGDGYVVAVKDGKATNFCEGLDDPKGIVFTLGAFYVADRDRVWKIDAKGKATVFKKPEDFPVKPLFLNDIGSIVREGKPTIFVSDSGNLKGGDSKVFRIDPTGKTDVLVSSASSPLVKTSNGVFAMSEFHLLLLDFFSGDLLRVGLADGKIEKIADGFPGGDGIACDMWGRTYLSSWKDGKVWVMARPNAKPKLLASGFEQAADHCLSADGKSILVPDMKGGALYSVPCMVPGEPLDEKPLPVELVPAFAEVEWTGWSERTPAGIPTPLRPIVLTHAGDGSGDIYMATQHGVIHRVKKGAKKSEIVLDIRSKVQYDDKSNEEGFLGLTFPPKFKEKNEFYVYYTPKRKGKIAPFPKGGRTSLGEPMLNVVARYKVGKDGLADKKSEEILLSMEKPFWNHDGGSMAFGPDGMLYISVGDGGWRNDPYDHAQNKKSLLGKILRIDVSKKGAKTPYAIPADNPFVDGKEALPEIWALGLRNVWRMSFDRKTGKLWGGEVGQNLWEEIILIEKGGNYGWNRRESFHPFGKEGVESAMKKEFLDPIWEYHHDLGKSITGGYVYRGKAVPALVGKYLYSDYVAGSVYALHYDEKAKRVTGNHLLAKKGYETFSFGEDEAGEVYVLQLSPTGKGISTFAVKK